MTLLIDRLPQAHPDVQFLVDAVQQEYVVRYGGFDETPVSEAEFDPPEGEFYVAFQDGEPVASAAWRWRRDLGPLTAELKRMFVVPRARHRGHARRLLAHVEAAAASAGARQLVLETGSEQPEAIALYVSSGYLAVAPFGHYRDEPGVSSLGKQLSCRG